MKQPPPLPPHIPAVPTTKKLDPAPPATKKPAAGATKLPQTQLSRAQSGLGAWLVRVALVLLCAGSCWLLYWSFASRLQPVNREQQKKTIEMSRLADEVEQIRHKLEQKQVEEVTARYQAAQEFLFANAQDLSVWENDVRTQAGSARLEAVCELGQPEPHPQAQQKLSLTKAQVGIRPAYIPGATNSPYRQLLSFTQNIAKSAKRFDLLELSVEGDTNSVKQALAVVQLWADGRKSQ